MRHIFITFGSDKYYFSRLRLAKQARKSGLFDKVKVYTPADLPDEITGSDVYSESNGGGLWIWKPWVISNTLKQCEVGDVVWYADSGCGINPDSDEWKRLFAALRDHDSLFFAYRGDFDYHWDRFGVNSVNLRHWTKPVAREFLTEYSGTGSYFDMPSLWAGFMAIKKTGDSNRVVDEWLRLMLQHPEIVCDPSGRELDSLPEDFNIHRYDQPLLTCIVRKTGPEANALVLDETAESRIGNPGLIAERYRAGKTSFWPDLKTRIYYMFYDR